MARREERSRALQMSRKVTIDERATGIKARQADFPFPHYGVPTPLC
jgi:hypothetical protein